MTATLDHLTFADANPAARQEALDRIFGFINLAALIGSGVTIGLVYGLRGRMPQGAVLAEELAEECLEWCARHAESSGVNIVTAKE
jgi:sugar phosphate isomerase/epimerase